jgi:glycosyltransferase involved in cell wall biosynthesis
MTSICILVQSVYDFDPRVRRKAEALVAAGYSVDVLALRRADGASSYTLNGVHVETIGLGKKRGSLARYMFEYAAFFAWAFVRLPLLMRRRRYAVIDVNTLPDFLVFAPLLARWMGAKIILDMHEITPEFYMSKYGIAGTSWLVRFLTYLERASVDFADHVIAINEPILDLLVSRGLRRSKSTVVMNAVDEARFDRASSRAVAVPGSASPSRFVMMYHGTLTQFYGLDLAVEAFGLAHEDLPGAELWILGSGPDLPLLKALAKKQGVAEAVRFVGQVPAADIPAWLHECDLGLLPIRRDAFLDFAFPNKLPEFIIFGKAVLISRLKAIQHYFSDQALAFFEPNDPVDLARQMVRVYRDGALRDRLAARARTEYAPIRWELMKRRYLDLVAGMAGSKTRAPERSQSAETTVLAG